MFRFFTSKKWFLWAYLGSFVILTSLWLSVQIDVKINEWFGGFYDMIQKALGTPNAITMNEYLDGLYSFGKLAALWILLGLATSFLTSHFLFRWRSSMVEFYHSVYDKARTIEGAS
jgi:peptide/bleomycin uptake transporter